MVYYILNGELVNETALEYAEENEMFDAASEYFGVQDGFWLDDAKTQFLMCLNDKAKDWKIEELNACVHEINQIMKNYECVSWDVMPKRKEVQLLFKPKNVS